MPTGADPALPLAPALRRRHAHSHPSMGNPRPAAPILHMHRREQNGLFDKFTTHFQALWETGWTIDQDPDALPPDPAANPSQYLDRPEHPRRPTFAPYGRRQRHLR